MKHYTIERWVDYSRNLVGTEERAQMQQHLADNCRECGELSLLMAKLSATCESMQAVQVPDSALRLARAIFPVRVTDRPKRGNRLPVELIFDSFLTPVPVGLRATWQVGWQGLYHAGDCSLDLRIEPDLTSQRASVIGQIANHALPDASMGHLPVTLRAGREVVAETVSNQFGEFQMDYEQRARLRLRVQLQDSSVIEVSLKKLTSERAAVESRENLRKQ
jgi:hypothetical protein